MKPGGLLLIFSVLFFIPSIAQSQVQNEDVVYLKNGSILYGKLTKQAGDKVGIEIIGHNILVFTKEEIDSVKSSGAAATKHHSGEIPLEVASALNFYGGSNSSAGFHILTGYRLPFRTTVGLGTGVDFFQYQVMPVYAEINHSIFRSWISPFVYARAGYSFPLSREPQGYYYEYSNNNTDYKGGITCGMGAGIRANFNPRFSMALTVGCRYQKLRQVTSYEYYWNGNVSESIERIDHLNRINLAVSLLFKQ